MADITVTVSDDHLARIDEVAAALRDNGMQVRQVHNHIGVISGSVPDDRREPLQAVDGVEAVEDDVSFQLPPPNSPVQ
jgi:hypothetical protein